LYDNPNGNKPSPDVETLDRSWPGGRPRWGSAPRRSWVSTRSATS